MSKYDWKKILQSPALAELSDPAQKRQALSDIWEDEFKDDPELSGIDPAGRQFIKQRFLSDLAPDLYGAGAQGGERPGFFQNWWEMVNPVPMLKLGVGVGSFVAHPSAETAAASGIPELWEGVKGQWQRATELKQEAQKKGQFAEATYRGLTGLPVVGPVIERVGEEVRAGNLPGLAGTIAGAATPFGAPKLLRGAAKVTKSSAIRQYQRAVRPSLKRPDLVEALEETTATRPARGPQMLEAGLTGSNLKEVMVRAHRERKLADDAVNAAEAELMGRSKVPGGKLIRVKPMRDHIMEQFRLNTTVGPKGKPIPIPGKEQLVDQLRENMVFLNKIVDRSGRLPASELVKLKQAWDSVTKRGDVYQKMSDLTPEQLAYRHSADGARRLLRSESPKLASLYDLYGFWADSYRILRSAYATAKEGTKADLASSIARRAIVVGTVGAGTYGVSSHWIPAIATAAVAGTADAILKNPGYRMLAASAKNRIADVLFQPDVQLATRTLGQIANAMNITLEYPPEETQGGTEDYDWTPQGGLVPRRPQ